MGRCCFCHIIKSKESGRTFHKFPLNNPHRLQQWLKNFPLKDWQPSKDSLLCSDHFTEDCFDRTGFRVHLQPNSIPTQFGEARSLCAYCKKKKLYKSGLSFFRFPLDHPRILKRWLQNMGKEDWTPSADSYLCSTHFESDCLRLVKEKYPILKKGSVPTIFNINQIITEADKMPRMESVNENIHDEIVTDNADESVLEPTYSNTNTIDTIKYDEMREFIHFPDDRINKENEVEKNGCILLDIFVDDEEIDQSCNIDDSRIITGEDCIFSFNDEMEQSLSVPMDFETSIPDFIQPNPIRHKPGEMVDHDHSYMDPPTLAQKKLIECQKAVKKKDAIIKLQTRKLQRLEKKVISLKEIVGDLRQKLKNLEKESNSLDNTPTG